MSWLMDSAVNVMLAAFLLFGAGLGFGGMTSKGWMLLSVLKKKNGNNKDQTHWPAFYKEYLLNPQTVLPCKDHSGLVADVKHLIRGNEEIKGVLNDLWSAVNELRKELMNRRGGAV